MKESELRVLFVLQLGGEPYIQAHAPRLGQRVRCYSLRTTVGVCRRLVALGYATEMVQGPFLIWRIKSPGNRIELRVKEVRYD